MLWAPSCIGEKTPEYASVPPYALETVTVEPADHYKVMREFCVDPAGFVEAAIEA